MCLVQRRLHSSRQRNVILFQQNRVIQPKPVIRPAAHLHRVLFQLPQSRRRLPCIPNPRPRPAQLLHKPPRQRRYPTQMPQKIQRRPLSRQNRSRFPRQPQHILARLDELPVHRPRFHSHLRIQPPKHHLRQRQSSTNQFLLRHNMRPPRSTSRNCSRNRSVAGPNIFRQRPLNHLSHILRIPIHIHWSAVASRRFSVGSPTRQCSPSPRAAFSHHCHSER